MNKSLLQCGTGLAQSLTVCAILMIPAGCRSLSPGKPKAERPALLGPRALVPPPYTEPTADVSVPAPPPAAAFDPGALPPIGDMVLPPPPPPEGVRVTLPPPVETQALTYKVKKGDTLWDIARMYGVTHQELAAHNDLKLDGVLKVNVVLRIPPGGRLVPPEQRAPRRRTTAPTPKPTPKPTPAPAVRSEAVRPPTASGNKYTVQQGDSIWSIARHFNVKGDDLRKLNNLQTDVLQIGQMLVIPGAPAAVVPTLPVVDQTQVAPGVAPGVESVVPPPVGTDVAPKQLEHTVTLGENLEIIAAMYNADVEAIKKANPGIGGDADLRPNMKIQVPYRE